MKDGKCEGGGRKESGVDGCWIIDGQKTPNDAPRVSRLSDSCSPLLASLPTSYDEGQNDIFKSPHRHEISSRK